MKKKGKTSKITTPLDAEARARQLIKDRNPSVRQILSKKTSKEGDLWLLEGEVLLKRLRFFKVKKTFKLEIRVEDGELISIRYRR